MNTFKLKLITFGLAIAFTFPVLSINPEMERKLVEKALIEGAITKEQRVAVAKYIAGERRKMAASYREAAVVSHGGKAVSQEVQKRRLIGIAEELEKEAQEYEAIAGTQNPKDNLAHN